MFNKGWVFSCWTFQVCLLLAFVHLCRLERFFYYYFVLFSEVLSATCEWYIVLWDFYVTFCWKAWQFWGWSKQDACSQQDGIHKAQTVEWEGCRAAWRENLLQSQSISCPLFHCQFKKECGLLVYLFITGLQWSLIRFQWNNDVVCCNLISYLPIWQHVNLVNGDLDARGLVSFYFVYLIVLNKAYKLLWKQQ